MAACDADATGDATATGRSVALATAAVAALGAVAALRRLREARDERRGLLSRLGPDGPGQDPPDRLGRVVAQWIPGRPRTAGQWALSMAWAAPATVAGLLLAIVGRGEIAWDGDVGAWVATGVGGPSAIALRAAGMGANTVGHVVVCLADAPSQRLLDHEAVHVRQFERLGPTMYPLYLWLSARHGYRNNPIEVAARRGAARRASGREPLRPDRLGP